MKKVISLLLTVAILMSFMVTFNAKTTTTKYILGDVNGDGVIDDTDAIAMNRYVARLSLIHI